MRNFVRVFGIFASILVAGAALAEDNRPDQPTIQTPTAGVSYDQLMRDALGQQVSGDRGAAVETLRKAVVARPDAKAPHEKLCTLLYASGQLDDALQACRGWLDREKAAIRHGQIKALITILQRRLDATKKQG